MSLDRSVLAFAGVMTLLSVVLTLLVSPLFVWFTAFIGVNLLAVRFHRLLPCRLRFTQTRLQAGLCILNS